MRRGILAVLCAAIALTVGAGCGGGSDSSSTTGGGSGGASAGGASAYGGASTSSGAGSGAAASASGDGIVKTDDSSDLGEIIVDSEGFTLYDFHKDKGETSACYGACAKVWPPLLSKGDPQAQGGTMRSLLGTTNRTDGTVQVTYNGHPLYTYLGDKQPGDTNGHDFSQFGAQWYALTAAGEEPAD